MIVGSATLNVHIYNAQSLKSKRTVLTSMMKRAQNRFNISIAEVDEQDRWQSAIIGVAVVASTRKHAEQQLDAVVRFLQSDPRIEITAVSVECV